MNNNKKIYGLSDKEVKQRIMNAQTNHTSIATSKSLKQIIQSNAFTRFNFINVVIALLVLSTGSFKNVLFLGVVISNFLIGTIQEIRTKRVLDKIALITARKVNVLRNQELVQVAVEDVVLDDVMYVSSGDQIVSDCKLIDGSVEVNEALLSGESNTLVKHEQDILLSGSFVVSGIGYVKVIRVGDDNYASKLVKDAKHMKQHPSQLRDALYKIIRIISIWLVPLGILLFFQSYGQTNYQTAILRMSAAIIGMIPEGLVILTSIALAVGIVNITKYKALVQELYCLETLARVDVICMDKTGTITKGNLRIKEVIAYDDTIDEIMGNYIRVMQDNNATFLAFKARYLPLQTKQEQTYQAFASHRGYSSVTFEDGIYRLGRFENTSQDETVAVYAKAGYRVLSLSKQTKTSNLLLALFVLEDEIKLDAKATIDFFKQQAVNIKILSGDDPKTVAHIAKRVGFDDVDPVDLRYVERFDEALINQQIFGRATPQSKKQFIETLQAAGHTVAMIGDGVNDVLAFKQADISIVMAQGSDVCKATANVVLLDNDFKALPHILNEGRRVINNIEKVATLFLTKTILSFCLSILVIILQKPYPFIPIQLTLVSTLTIGIPSFVLALEPNFERIKGRFLENIAKISFPSAISMAITWLYLVSLLHSNTITHEVYIQLNFIMLASNGIFVLYQVSHPFSKLRSILFIVVCSSMVISIVSFYKFFEIKQIQWSIIWLQCLIVWVILVISRIIIRICVNYLYAFKKQRV